MLYRPSEIPLTHLIRIDRSHARLAARPFPSCRVPRRFLSVTSQTKTKEEERKIDRRKIEKERGIC